MTDAYRHEEMGLAVLSSSGLRSYLAAMLLLYLPPYESFVSLQHRRASPHRAIPVLPPHVARLACATC